MYKFSNTEELYMVETKPKRLVDPKRKREYLKAAKLKVVEGYGGRCACAGCTETKWEFLTIDHIDGGGNIDRRATLLAGAKLYGWLIRNGFPKGKYQLLCYNCNCARHVNGGICPHIERALLPAKVRESKKLGSRELQCAMCPTKFMRQVRSIRSTEHACSISCRNALVAKLRWGNKKMDK
jgi:hypothetical protein